MSAEHLAITGRTAMLTIIGDPIAQARSLMMINRALAERGRAGDAVMVPLHVPAPSLATTVAGLRAIKNFRGAIITMPHKTGIVPLLDEITPEAQQVGACNVVRVDAAGRLIGTIFDGEGFVAGLKSAGHSVTGKRCLLVGAGGAAAAIAFALGKHGASQLTLKNRTQAKAVELADRVKRAWPARAVSTNDSGTDYDFIINATSLGMKDGDELPVELQYLKPPAVAVEIVAVPEITAFLTAAANNGCQTHPGKPMIAAQIDLMMDFFGF